MGRLCGWQKCSLLLLPAFFGGVDETACAAAVASDSASNSAYAAETGGAWKGLNPTSGENPPGADNGGFGFQPWNFAGGFQYPESSPYGRLNHFIDGVDFLHSSYNDLGAPAFGLTNANIPFGGSTARATRSFDSLAVGSTITVDFDNPVLAPFNPAIPDPGGFIIRLNSGGGPAISGSGVAQRFGFFTTAGYINGNWATADMAGNSDTGLSSNQTTSGASFRFTLTGAESYSVEILPRTGGSPLFTHSGSLANTGAGAIDSLEIVLFENGSGNRISGAGGQPTGQSEFFFNNLQINSAGIEGDYNADGRVDGADFLIWQRLLGSSSSLADGNHSGTIDTGDLVVWKDHFGISGSVTSVSSVPEPSVAVFLWAACFAAARAAGTLRRESAVHSVLSFSRR
jgi:hypothetical protein